MLIKFQLVLPSYLDLENDAVPFQDQRMDFDISSCLLLLRKIEGVLSLFATK
jgi:hypothetical protein